MATSAEIHIVEYDDWDLHYDVKDPICDIIDIIMAGAEDCAATTRWRIEHSS